MSVIRFPVSYWQGCRGPSGCFSICSVLVPLKRAKMKIGIMCHSTCGGSARIAVESGIELALHGHDVHIFARTPLYFTPDIKIGITTHTVYESRFENEHPSFILKEWPDDEYDSFIELVISVIEKTGIDILHAHYALPFAFLAGKIRQKLGRGAPAMVATLHGTDVLRLADETDKSRAFSQDLAMFDALTTVSSGHAHLFATLSQQSRDIEIIPNFVDLCRFRPADLPVKGSKPVFCHVSNFRSVKDIAGTIEIFARISEKIDAELLLIGDGEELNLAQELVRQKNLQKKVTFFWLVQDVSHILRNADFLIISSMYESFCIAALEAMACGVPVIAPRVGGLPEVIIHEKTGFLFVPGDYAAGADYAVQLLSETEQYTQISRNAADHAGKFDRREIVKLYEKLYYKLISGEE